MTSSETPTDDDEAELPAAVAHEREPDAGAARSFDPDQLMRLAVIGVAVLAGWVFILYTHNFRFGAPVFFLWVGWLAVVMGVHYLWRTGTATADAADEDAAWWRPTGAREELEREKRSLLKAIKEVEFDHQTGKMSEKDAQAMTRVYRARAIEVIKALDEIAAGGKRSTRQQIEREVRARLAIEGQAKKGGAAAEKRKNKGKGKAPPTKPVEAKVDENKGTGERKLSDKQAEDKQAEDRKGDDPKAADPQEPTPVTDEPKPVETSEAS